MRTIYRSSKKGFWAEVIRLVIPLFFAFLLIIFFLNSGSDLLAGNYSNIFKDTFVGVGAIIFFGSVVLTSFLCSIAIVYYDREEIEKENN